MRAQALAAQVKPHDVVANRETGEPHGVRPRTHGRQHAARCEGFLKESRKGAGKNLDGEGHVTPLHYPRFVVQRHMGSVSMPHVKAAFDAFYAQAQEACPGLAVRLVVDPSAGKRGGRSCARAYAYCTCDPRKKQTPVKRGPGRPRKRKTGEAFIVAVAPKIEEADDGRLEALLCHEIAHAVLLHHGYDEHTERDADLCAEQLFGISIYYDVEDVQTTDPMAKQARRPRPYYLDDEDGFTRTT